MASGPITSWEIDGETVETMSDFIFGAPKSLQMVTVETMSDFFFFFLCSKITAGGDCSHEIKRRLLLEEKL